MKQVFILLLMLNACLIQQVCATEEDAPAGAKKSIPERVGDSVKKGGEAAGRGIEKGAKAAGKGIKKGGEWAGRGLKKAGEKLEKVSK
ncbi:MAG: hypothetical protein HKM00_10015 [Gallionella sp.]|jgi:hypothetical protein|nr:hypothetical protein [Gallionella sp.]